MRRHKALQGIEIRFGVFRIHDEIADDTDAQILEYAHGLDVDGNRASLVQPRQPERR